MYLYIATLHLAIGISCRLRSEEHQGHLLLDGAGGDQADGARQDGRHLVRGLHHH